MKKRVLLSKEQCGLKENKTPETPIKTATDLACLVIEQLVANLGKKMNPTCLI